jgi:outer membrane protein OmpA-like peptidoglycan-associated protein
MRRATWVTIIGLAIGFCLIPVASYAKNSYFGVSNKALAYPQEFDETEAAIAKAEQSPGAKNCPDKLAKAKELAKKGVETYWACRTKEGLAMLAQARQLAEETEQCKGGPPPKTVTLTSGFLFALDSAVLTAAGRAALDKYVPELKANPNTKVVIAGHTCSLGSDLYNQDLSERRAQAAADYLISRGIAAERFTIFGYGEIRPAFSNDTEAGRAKNRRVELTIK